MSTTYYMLSYLLYCTYTRIFFNAEQIHQSIINSRVALLIMPKQENQQSKAYTTYSIYSCSKYWLWTFSCPSGNCIAQNVFGILKLEFSFQTVILIWKDDLFLLSLIGGTFRLLVSTVGKIKWSLMMNFNKFQHQQG